MAASSARHGLLDALERLGRVRTTELTYVVDGLYALASIQTDRRSAYRELRERLALRVLAQPERDGWLALLDVHLATPQTRRATLERCGDALERCSPWTRLLVGAELARVELTLGSTERAWSRLVALPFAVAVGQDRSLPVERGESPGLHAAVCTYLDAAALHGAWREHDELARWAEQHWAERSDERAALSARLADAAITRGDYLGAASRLQRTAAPTSLALAARLDCTRLRLLITLGKGDRSQARRIRQSVRHVLRHGASAMTRAERSGLREQLAALSAPTRARQHPPSARRGAVASLLAREQRAEKSSGSTRAALLAGLLAAAGRALLKPSLSRMPEESIRLRMLWCRCCINLDHEELYDACELELERALRDARKLGSRPLEMLVRDQRAVLRGRREPIDLEGALRDSGAACRLAMTLLEQNQDAQGGLERSLLLGLLPVFDRMIEVCSECTLRIMARGRGAAETEQSLQRFGRLLQCHAEQAQALALAEARRAFDDGRTSPHRFALALDELPSALVDGIRRDLGQHDAVLQYFVAARYVLVFGYGRRFFVWHVSRLDERHGAERALEDLLRRMRSAPPAVDAQNADARRLLELLLPPSIDDALASADIRHLRIVPHSVLYRVPFGSLRSQSGRLNERFSLSLHPTGRLAADSAQQVEVPQRRAQLGHVIGPEASEGGGAGVPIRCAQLETKALRAAFGRAVRWLRVLEVDGITRPRAELLARLPRFALLHFTCHGEEGGAFGRQPGLLAGKQPARTLQPKDIVTISMQGCQLVFLQSCATGWLEHVRTHPVQGLPQAFCDAGVRAVIAPLTLVDQVLAPYFTAVFYRALRFLPAERALQRTLEVARSHGRALLANDPAALQKLDEQGGDMSAFEYRYTGVTGVALGSWLSRLLGRLAFWWFVFRLRRARE